MGGVNTTLIIFQCEGSEFEEDSGNTLKEGVVVFWTYLEVDTSRMSNLCT